MKYDPGYSSRIRILFFFIHPGTRIQGSKKAPDPGSRGQKAPDPASRGQKGTAGSRIQGSKRHRIPDPDLQHWIEHRWAGASEENGEEHQHHWRWLLEVQETRVSFTASGLCRPWDRIHSQTKSTDKISANFLTVYFCFWPLELKTGQSFWKF